MSDFLETAESQQFLDAETARGVRQRAASQETSVEQIIFREGLLDPVRFDIVETLCRPDDAIPGYRITGVLGRGGMGVVYSAEQTALGRPVAIKTVLVSQLGNAEEAQIVLGRFEQEAKTVGRLRHPNIVTAYDFGRHEGRFYFVMEFIEGEDLEQAITRVAPATDAYVWGVIRQAAAALSHAAGEGVIHRDIKPGNLLLVEPPAGFPLPPGMPLVKVADFGLALLTHETAMTETATRLTAANTTVGSPRYMAPEQMRGSDVGPAADIYGLGATAYHLIAGVAPYNGLTTTEIMMEKLAGQVPNFEGKRTSLAPGTSELVADMLQTDPRERISDYSELLSRIDRIMPPYHASGTITIPSADSAAETQVLSTIQARPGTDTQTTATDATLAEQPVATAMRRLPAKWIGISALGVTLAILGAFVIPKLLGKKPYDPGTRDLKPTSNIVPLFKGQSTTGWEKTGGWFIAQHDGSPVFASESGVARRGLFFSKDGKTKPATYYRLGLIAYRHKATRIEVRFDISADEDGKSHVLRLADGKATLHAESTAEPVASIDLPAKSDARVAIRIERHSRAWWVSVNGNETAFPGLKPIGGDRLPEFQLVVEGGEGRFSDLSLMELADR